MAQAVKRGGVVAAYVWDYAGRMEMIRHFWEAAIAIDPTAAELDSGKQFPICQPDNFRALFEQEALNDIELIPIDVQARFTNFEDFWLPFLGAQGSVSKYLRSLDGDTLSRISEQLHKQLPVNSDGTIDLILRAWAVKSIR
ncbi:MAG: SAM-dependent methyltransferase, partial [Burkholderiales bacterium]|nr:SAM-dependent methyltransferase [Anaerolineae bacterium]